MRKVELSLKEKERYEIIKKLVETNGNKERARIKLRLKNIRQINRLIAGYKEYGKEFFIHGNRGRKPKHALTTEFKDEIETLYTSKYFDCTYTQFKEYLAERENIFLSIQEVGQILRERHILSPRARKITKKNLKKKLIVQKEKATSKKELAQLQANIVALEDAHPRQPRCIYFGEEIQTDACIHLWFGNFKTALHAAIDDSTGHVVAAYFDNQETLNGYYNIYYQILTKYGIPYKFLTDNRTVFNYLSLNPNKRTSDKDVLTQFGYACKQLGIELKTTSVSQAKGLIERTNGTFQGRLVNELRLNGITTIEEANKYLIEVFVPKFNNKFAIDYKKFPSVFETAPSKEKINYTLAVLTPRKIDNGNSIKFKTKYYQPYLNDELKCFLPKTECLVINAFNGDLLVAIDDKVFELKELSRNERFSKEFDEVNDEKEKVKYIPPMTHPWKIEYFKKQLKKAHTNHVYA